MLVEAEISRLNTWIAECAARVRIYRHEAEGKKKSLAGTPSPAGTERISGEIADLERSITVELKRIRRMRRRIGLLRRKRAVELEQQRREALSCVEEIKQFRMDIDRLLSKVEGLRSSMNRSSPGGASCLSHS